ncbi:MAG: lysophospholipid acyltransferase family protein [bacterium]
MANSTQNSALRETKGLTPVQQFLGSGIKLFKIGWLSFWLFFATILVAFPILATSFLPSSGNFAFNLARVWAWIILHISGVRLIITGTEKLDKNRSYIIISNHQSHFDGPAIAASLGIQFRWIAKKELLRIPVFGHALKASGNIFIDRRDRESALKNIREGIRQLPQGVGVMVFAEGTRSENNMVGPFKKGGFLAAIQTGFPILPLTISGSARALPKGGIVFHPGTIEIRIGDIIETTGYKLDQLDELTEKTRNIIISNCH